MTIDWMAFVVVVAASLVAACGLVTVFALALRLSSDGGRARRAAAVALYALCVALVLFGIYLIVPLFR